MAAALQEHLACLLKMHLQVAGGWLVAVGGRWGLPCPAVLLLALPALRCCRQ
jgi:hypothetical protein